ncbi:MAG: hypothetical protein ACI9MB_005005 [Verrucomicrobiales bacterium]|jgi:hypothetical protein
MLAHITHIQVEVLFSVLKTFRERITDQAYNLLAWEPLGGDASLLERCAPGTWVTN